MGIRHHFQDHVDIFGQRIFRSIDHHGRIKAGIDAVVAGGFVAVIEMNRIDRVGVHRARAADDGFDHGAARILARALGNLNDERRLRLKVALKQP